MTWESWVWAFWLVAALGVEGIALIQKDRPGKPRTLSANLRWLVQPAAGWHTTVRWLFVLFLAWFKPHILGP